VLRLDPAGRAGLRDTAFVKPELAQISAQLVEPVAGTDHEVVGAGRAVSAGGEVGDVAF
jgi:hypothetical protein